MFRKNPYCAVIIFFQNFILMYKIILYLKLL